MFKVTAYWENAIIVGLTMYNVYEINDVYYIMRECEQSVSGIENHLNYEKGFYQKCLPNYTKDILQRDGDEYGILSIISQKDPTWTKPKPKCECGGWVCGSGCHDHWCPAR